MRFASTLSCRSMTGLYALQATIPQLTRSSLHRCLERHGISRLPEVEGDKPRKKKFDIYPIGFFHIDLAEVRTAEGKLYLFVAIDRTSKFAVVELVEKADMQAARCLPRSTRRSRSVSHPHRAHRQRNPVRRSAEEPWRAYGKMAWTSLRSHLSSSWHRPPYDPTQPSLDQLTGRTDEPDHQGSHRQTLLLYTHEQLKANLSDFITAYNFARRLKTLRGPTPYEAICILWTRPRQIYTRPNPPNAGTKHLDNWPWTTIKHQ